jgi:hypothetical protein
MHALLEIKFVMLLPGNGNHLGALLTLRAVMHQFQKDLRQRCNIGFITPLED